jgi:hypothetical protein
MEVPLVKTSRMILALVTALLLVSVSIGSALAGEITGNGKDLKPLNANSECAFSGLDDADDDGFVHTQSWGRLGKEGRAFVQEMFGLHPSVSCNGHLSPLKH